MSLEIAEIVLSSAKLSSLSLFERDDTSLRKMLNRIGLYIEAGGTSDSKVTKVLSISLFTFFYGALNVNKSEGTFFH